MIIFGGTNLGKGNPPTLEDDIQAPGHHRIPVRQPPTFAVKVNSQIQAADELVFALPPGIPAHINITRDMACIVSSGAKNCLVYGPPPVLLGNREPGNFTNPAIFDYFVLRIHSEMPANRKAPFRIQDNPGRANDPVLVIAAGKVVNGILIIFIEFNFARMLIGLLKPPLVDIHLVPQGVDVVQEVWLVIDKAVTESWIQWLVLSAPGQAASIKQFTCNLNDLKHSTKSEYFQSGNNKTINDIGKDTATLNTADVMWYKALGASIRDWRSMWELCLRRT